MNAESTIEYHRSEALRCLDAGLFAKALLHCSLADLAQRWQAIRDERDAPPPPVIPPGLV